MTTKPIPDYTSYDVVIVSFSGGKDSTAALGAVLDEGCDPRKVELWHQAVDGMPGSDTWADWPCTESYVRRFGQAFGHTTLFQWKVGGFLGEMLRDHEVSAGVGYETIDGGVVHLPPSPRARPGTRLKFPQVSGDLNVRWCSAYLKIDVANRVIAADPRFKDARVLVVTGERGEESPARAKYETLEPHRRTNRRRKVDQYRPVLRWSEARVWDRIKKMGARPHPAYYIGFGRVSCMKCIFGNDDQWHTLDQIDREGLASFKAFEARFGLTIHRTMSIEERVARGKSLLPPGHVQDLAWALSRDLPIEAVKVAVEDWKLPAGAYRRCGGPT